MMQLPSSNYKGGAPCSNQKKSVTTDFSDESDSALREAVGIGEQFRSTVYLLHVIPEPWQYGVDYVLSEPMIAAEKGSCRMKRSTGWTI